MIDSDPLLFIAKLTWLKLHKLDIVKDTDVIIMKNNMGKPLFHRMEFWRRVIGKYGCKHISSNGEASQQRVCFSMRCMK